MRRQPVVLFDLDGVLVDSGAAVERAWSAWADRQRLDPVAVIAVAHGRRTTDTIRRLAPHLPAESEARALELLAVQDTGGERAVPGAKELIAELNAERWAVVTSGSRPLATARLCAAGLPIPAVLVTAEDVSRGKPDPEGYLSAAAQLGTEAGRCVVIEDSPAGVAAARAAGMTVIGLTSTHAESELAGADVVITALSEAPAAMRTLGLSASDGI